MKLLILSSIFVSLLFLSTNIVFAGCGVTGGSGEAGCPGLNDKTGCNMTSSSSFDQTDCYNNGCGGYNCNTTSYSCSASDGHTGDWWAVELCRGHGGGGCTATQCNGTIGYDRNDCNKGAAVCTSCNDDWPDGRTRNHQACCTDANHVGCTWNGNSGLCEGTGNSYQCQTKCGDIHDQSTCTSRSCNWNPCANGSVCSSGKCNDACGVEQPCSHYYTAVSPNGLTTTTNPTLIWSTDNVVGAVPPGTCSSTNRTYNCMGIFAGSGCPGAYVTSSCPTVSARSSTVSQLSPISNLTPGTTYSWNIYGCFPDGYFSTSNCQTFTTPAATPAPTPPPASPWWQVKDADVITNGGLTSSIPSTCTGSCNSTFDLPATGGFPGVPSYNSSTKADFSAQAGNGTVSNLGWLANSQTQYRRIYDYNFYKTQIPSDIQSSWTEINQANFGCTPGTGPCSINGGDFNNKGNPSPSHGGYVWFHFDGNTYGNLSINSNVTIASGRKVVLLVDGADLNLNGKINIAQNFRGSSFFMALVGKKSGGGSGGNILVSSSLGSNNQVSLDGLYSADGTFSTGAGNNQLWIRGSVIAYGGVNLQRNLTDNSATPAEFFEYAPELLTLYPDVFTTKRLRWKEVAP